jgi:hypothetical protein
LSHERHGEVGNVDGSGSETVPKETAPRIHKQPLPGDILELTVSISREGRALTHPEYHFAFPLYELEAREKRATEVPISRKEMVRSLRIARGEREKLEEVVVLQESEIHDLKTQVRKQQSLIRRSMRKLDAIAHQLVDQRVRSASFISRGLQKVRVGKYDKTLWTWSRAEKTEAESKSDGFEGAPVTMTELEEDEEKMALEIAVSEDSQYVVINTPGSYILHASLRFVDVNESVFLVMNGKRIFQHGGGEYSWSSYHLTTHFNHCFTVAQTPCSISVRRTPFLPSFLPRIDRFFRLERWSTCC